MFIFFIFFVKYNSDNFKIFSNVIFILLFVSNKREILLSNTDKKIEWEENLTYSFNKKWFKFRNCLVEFLLKLILNNLLLFQFIKFHFFLTIFKYLKK